MGFGKAFALSLVAFIGLNFGLLIIIQAIGGIIADFFTSLADMSVLGSALFGPIATYPGAVATDINDMLLVGPFDLADFLGYIFFIVAPLLAAILAGRLGESRTHCFGAWFLVAMVSMGGYLTLVLITGVPESQLVYTIISIIISGVLNGFFYGCFSLLVAKSEFY